MAWKLLLFMIKGLLPSRSCSPSPQIYLRILKSCKATRNLIFMRTASSPEKKYYGNVRADQDAVTDLSKDRERETGRTLVWK